MPFETDIQNCVQALQNRGIILYPTDTVWGLGCDATNEAAVNKIFAAKQRAESKSLIVLVADEQDILQYVSAPDLALFDYLQEQQQPTTVIYGGVIGLADNVLAADGSAGIRIANDPFCKALIKRLGNPIVSTSANISGEPAPRFFSEISEAVKNKVEYIVQHRQDDETPAMPSRIIKWENGEVVVVRE